MLIEEIELKSLQVYIDKKIILSINLLESLKDIRLDILNEGLFDYGDFYFSQHIYIDERKICNEYGIMIIDFDYLEASLTIIKI